MANINDVLLFVSTAAPKTCAPCLAARSKFRLPIKVIKLDDSAARQRAANGRFFQITSVPTLVVVLDDGRMQIFLGMEKIVRWMSSMSASPAIGGDQLTTEPQQTGKTAALGPGGVITTPGNLYGPGTRGPPPGLSPDGSLAGSLQIVEDDSDTEVDTGDNEDDFVPMPLRNHQEHKRFGKNIKSVPRVIEDPEEEDTEIIIPQKPRTNPKELASSSAKKKSPKVTAEDVEEEAPRAKSTSKTGKTAKKTRPAKGERVKFDIPDANMEESKPRPIPRKGSSKMKNIHDMAKQLEQDRSSSLGYNESELPKY